MTDYISILDYPVVDNALTITDAVISSTNGDALVSSKSHTFTNAAIGKAIDVRGAGPQGLDLGILSSTIVGVSNGSAILANPATTPVSGAIANFGTLNTTALQEAITAASGKTLIIPPGSGTGVYFTGGLTFGSNTSILGLGGTLLKSASNFLTNTPLLQSSTGASNIRICNLTLIGEGQNIGSGFGGQRAGILTQNATNVYISENRVSQFQFAGIETDGGTYTWILDNYVTDCCQSGQHNGITLNTQGGETQNPSFAVVRGNHVDGCETGALVVTTATPNLNQCTDISITGNNLTCSAFACIALETGGDGTGQQRIVINDNLCTQTGAAVGIQVADTSASRSTNANQFQSLAITGNIINALLGNGITTQSSYTTVTANTISCLSAGIRFLGNNNNAPAHNVATGNSIHLPSNGSEGIGLWTSYSSATDNRIEFDAEETGSGNGINVFYADYVSVADNVIINAPYAGISAYASKDVEVMGNTVRNSSAGGTGYGIGFADVTTTNPKGANIISGNNVIDDRATPLTVYSINSNGASNIVVTNNTLLGYTQGAISGNGVVVNQNNITSI